MCEVNRDAISKTRQNYFDCSGYYVVPIVIESEHARLLPIITALIEENEKLREAITNYINQNDCECGNDEGLVCFLHEGIQSSPLDELLEGK